MLDSLRESCEPTIVLFFAAIGLISTFIMIGSMIAILGSIAWDSLSDWRWRRNTRRKREGRERVEAAYDEMRVKYPELPENPRSEES